ncbi:MAG: energy transducer TonB, partial [Chitinophagaceae bacterium]|nr:energy transducer TonB [Chitinophagaceae bacterium]
EGRVQQVGVQKGADIELGRAATKLVYGFPKWKPAMVNGKPVNMKMVLPVVFKLK